MKQFTQILRLYLSFLFACLLFSCSHFHDDPTKSVWSGGLWLIPVAIAIGFVLAARNAWKASKSGTVEGGGYKTDASGRSYADPTRDVPGKAPMKKNGWLWFAIILFVAFWVVVYAVNHAR